MAVYNLCKPEGFRMLEKKDLDYINSKEDLSEKIFAMIQIHHLTDEDIAERKFLHSELIRFLQQYYPNCNILPFGSTVNGFGFKGCDLDLLFLPFPEYCNADFKDCEDVSVPNPSQVFKNESLRKKLFSMSETCHLKFVKHIFYTKRYFFKKIVFIPAKCPILKLEFVKSNITCDFSASNRLVLCNTELQSLYGSLDDRVKPLVMFLRYWAKALGFIQKHLLSSYSFSCLVIFYLQNTEPPILPSVKSLNELARYSDKIDGWETAICKNIYHIPRNTNSATVEQLLIGFFDFYWYFNFVQNVVSPHTGKAIPINEILESQDERIRTFQVSSFSIQDPFILSHNISRNASIKVLFKLALLSTKRLLLQGVSFETLFDNSLYQSEIDKLFEPVLQNFDPFFVLSTVCLSYEICCKLGITNEFDLWHEKVCETVLEVLQYGLLFECEVIDKARRKKGTPPFKKRKFDVGCENLELLMSIQCAVYYDTCHSRKNISLKEIVPELKEEEQWCSSVVLQEHYLSLKMIQGYENSHLPLLWVLCNCYKYSSERMPDVVLIFSPLTNVHRFSGISLFLKSYVQKQVIKILSKEQ